MSDHVYSVTEVVGSSSKGIDDAIAQAVARASTTVRNLEWFEVVGTRGHIVDGAVGHVQVTLKLGFRLDVE
ncbi:dodecin [Rhodococcus daqingensis]|uniref:Dodecin n=1 Tax=Rhodococcus daqingensis TaxID=2479363 RepID=A0ABW2RSD6_9NOCA